MKSLLFVLCWIPILMAAREKGIQAPYSVINNMFNYILRLEREMESTKSKLVASEKELESLKTSVNANGDNLRIRFNTLEERMLNLENLRAINGRERGITFHVRQKKHPISFSNNEVLRFDDVTLNSGNAYNPKSGIFTAPSTGMYLFWANVESADNGYFVITLQREHERIGSSYTSTGTRHGVATIVVMTKLEKGDRVWFANSERGAKTNIYGDLTSSYGALKYM